MLANHPIILNDLFPCLRKKHHLTHCCGPTDNSIDCMLQALFLCKVCVAWLKKDSPWILLGFHKGEKCLGRDEFGKCVPLYVLLPEAFL